MWPIWFAVESKIYEKKIWMDSIKVEIHRETDKISQFKKK